MRKLVPVLMYLAIFAFFAWLIGQFFYSDLGINESRNKQRAIAELKTNIAAIRRSAGERYAELEKLTRDAGAIRAYALLYGMMGGTEETPARGAPAEMIPLDEQPAYAALPKEKSAPRPFFVRHPILIVLAISICLGTGVFMLL